MSQWGKADFRQLQKLQQKLEKLQKVDLDKLCRDITKELAARLLRNAIKRTPVITGFLRGGWSTVAGLWVEDKGNYYEVVIINNTEYASYVEYGHRTRGGGGWAKGLFMLTKSEMEIEAQAFGIIQRRVTKALAEVFNNG